MNDTTPFNTPEFPKDACRNCGAVLDGKFCHECGQKRFVESDRRFGHLVSEFLSSATDLDNRIWRTVLALLFKPGLLSREFMQGRRARWLSPVSLFFAVSVVYFFNPLHGGDLSLQFNQQVSGHVRTLAASPDEKLSDEQRTRHGPWHAEFTDKWVDARVQARDAREREATGGAAHYTYHDYRLAYDAKADDVSKALVLLHIPFVAFVLMIMFVRQHHYFAEHFVVALHYFAFAMLILQIIVQLDALVGFVLPSDVVIPEDALDWILRSILSIYAIFAIRRAYGVGWVASVGAAAVMIAALVGVNIYIYRAIEFGVTFALT